MMYLAVAVITNPLPGIKYIPKNAAYFIAKIAITFEPDMLRNFYLHISIQQLSANKMGLIRHL